MQPRRKTHIGSRLKPGIAIKLHFGLNITVSVSISCVWVFYVNRVDSDRGFESDLYLSASGFGSSPTSDYKEGQPK